MLYVGSGPIGGRIRHVRAVPFAGDIGRQSVLCIEEEGAWIVSCDSDAVEHIAKLASLPSSGCVKWIGVGVGRTGEQAFDVKGAV